MVARRLAAQAVELNIIPQNYASAVPRRAATDLTWKLADVVIGESKIRKITSVVTFDIEGAFDAVRKNRLVTRLRGQQWPESLCKWVGSFLTDRRVSLSVEGGLPVEREVGGSLPQGSPVSPILYMLYMAELFKKLPSLGYADDGLIYVSSPSVQTNITTLQTYMTHAVEWCRENELRIDWSKTGVTHLYTGRKLPSMNTGLRLPNGTTLSPMQEMKWLGVIWDTSHNFKTQCQELTTKARKTANVLRRISRVHSGAPPNSVMQAVRACMLPQMTYAATTWFPRASKTSMGILEKVLREGLRAAVPVFKTTSKKCLYRFAAFPNMAIICQDMLRTGGIRASTCNADHPLYWTTIDGSIDEAKALLPHPIRDSTKLRPEQEGPAESLAEKLSKEEAAKAHLDLLSKESQETMWAYSDGSRNSDGDTGAGWAVYFRGKILAQGKGSCGRYREVADAEAIAALKAVRAAAEVAPSQAEGLNLCVDNLGVVKRIGRRMQKPGTSQLAIDEIRRTLARWQGGSDNLALDKPVGKVHWVPGHCEVPGNEAVDQLAKAGCKSEDLLVPKATMSLTAARRWRNEAFKADFRNWMKENCPKIKHLGGALNWPRPYDIGWMKGLHRGTVARILAARSGHGDFKEYHVWLNHRNAELHCPVTGCDQAKTFTHPWECLGNEKNLSMRFVRKLLTGDKSCRYLAGKLDPKWRVFRIGT
ncbi:putative double-stranded RNA/RNA-DNA hybrid binding protein [Ceratocystis lukuohia]|uniref:Double-stranded RNA/RNA-DNA hybrid binding protein n=1 Tax=Ceratocystis lukuohia TaxID=2019550 RepID=A0ABR4MA48_9PEZI